MKHDVTPAATIRAMTQHDLDTVVAIDAALEGQPRRAYFQRRLSAALKEPRLHVQLAAADADGLVGYVLARRIEGEFGRQFPGLRLEAIGVRPAQRGHGVGKLLLNALLHYAEQHGVVELRTAARWSDHAMLHWLDAVGFLLAPNQVVECAVDEGYRAERGDALELPEGLGTSPEINYGAPAGNDFDRVATLHCEVRPMAPADLPQIMRIDRELTGANREASIAAMLGEAMLDLRQPVGDGLLEHAPCVLVLFQVRPDGHDVGLERGDAGVAAIDLDQLAGAVQLGLLEAGAELVHFDGLLGPEPVAVGLDLRLADGHRSLEPLRRQPHCPRPECRRKQQPNQARNQEA